MTNNPPRSVTMAAALRIATTKSGCIGVTSTDQDWS